MVERLKMRFNPIQTVNFIMILSDNIEPRQRNVPPILMETPKSGISSEITFR